MASDGAPLRSPFTGEGRGYGLGTSTETFIYHEEVVLGGQSSA